MRIRSLTLALTLGLFLTAGCNQSTLSPAAPSSSPLGGARTAWKTGDGGCTPGYWKQAQHFDSWPSNLEGDLAQYSLTPGMTLDQAFGQLDRWNGDEITLEEALNLNGAGLNALLRHMVAALLNATLEFYPITWEELRQMVYAAHLANTREAIEALKDTLEGYNELGCPLN